MINPQPSPYERCTACWYPLDNAHIEWYLGQETLLLHVSCANALSKGLKREIHHFYDRANQAGPSTSPVQERTTF